MNRENTSLHLVILGGTGFIGSALLKRLADLPPGTVKTRVLVGKGKEGFSFPSGTVIEGSLPHVPQALFPKEPHVIIHLATKQVGTDPASFFYHNVHGTESLLKQLPTSTKGLIYASSTSVYGQGPYEGIKEDAPLGPKTELAKSRAAAETAIMRAMIGQNKSAVILRRRFILGNGDHYTLPGLINMVRAGVIVGTGNQAYTIIDVDDYAEVILRLARQIHLRDQNHQPLCAPFHVGYQRPLYLSEIVKSICRTFSLPQPRKKIPSRPMISKLLHFIPLNKAATLATRFELIGRSHYFNVNALAAEIGPGITDKDPIAVLSRSLKVLKRV